MMYELRFKVDASIEEVLVDNIPEVANTLRISNLDKLKEISVVEDKSKQIIVNETGSNVDNITNFIFSGRSGLALNQYVMDYQNRVKEYKVYKRIDTLRDCTYYAIYAPLEAVLIGAEHAGKCNFSKQGFALSVDDIKRIADYKGAILIKVWKDSLIMVKLVKTIDDMRRIMNSISSLVELDYANGQ